MFNDRKDAGEKLARALEKYKGKDVLVLAIPRGGVEVGSEVARALGAEFSIIVARKLPFPDEPEAGFGAIAEDGSTVILEGLGGLLPEETIEKIKKEQIKEIGRRVKALRGGRPLPKIRGRTVILVDDGLAMGSTMQAAVMLCRNQGAKKIIVAVPVAGREAADRIKRLADETVVLEMPPFFHAVAQAYRHWHDVTDEEVLKIVGR